MKRPPSNLYALGIALVAIPFLMQVAFAIHFADLLGQMQKRLETQWKSEEIVRLACQLCSDSTDVLVWIQLLPPMRAMVESEFTAKNIDKPSQEYQKLLGLVDKSTAQNEQFQSFTQAADHLFALLQKKREPISHAQSTPGSSANLTPLQQDAMERNVLGEYGSDFFDGIAQIVSAEEVKQAEFNAYDKKALANLNQRLLAYIVLTTAVTICLGFIYSRAISQPLQRLAENARRLARREKMPAPIGGNDAFGKLDKLFHLASSGIEEALQRERAVIENAADLIVTLDSKGCFETINPFALRMLGYSPDELVGQPAGTIAQPEQSFQLEENLRTAISAKDLKRFESKLQTKDGKLLDTTWSCIWSEREQKLFCIAHDITEEKTIELLKQDFADMISHDLRSPLMAMSGSLALVERGVKGEISESAKARVAATSKKVDSLIALVNDLLDFQKLKAGKMELSLSNESLNAISREASDLLAENARKKNIEIVLIEGGQNLELDKNKMMQVILNLMSNAIKFSQKDTKVIVTAQLTADSNGMLFSISDTGPGVPEEFRERIFQPFEQAPSSHAKEGTGLGLAICKLIVEAHGGKIWVEPKDDGSVFKFELPKRS